MKLITLSILLLTITLVMTKSKFRKTKNLAEKKGKGFPGLTLLPDSVSYGYASNDNYVLQNAAEFKSAQIMNKIPIHLNKPYTGVMAEARGFVTDKFYYNGENNLSAIHIDCNVYSTNPQSCVHNSKCGWCGEKNSCVAGSFTGPLAPCLRTTFLYMAPTPEWNPLKAGTVNVLGIDTKGKPQTTITWEPNLNKAPIYNPYK